MPESNASSGQAEEHEGADNIANHLTFAQLLKPASLPAPLLDHDGPPNQKLNPKERSAEQRDRPRQRTN